MKVYDRDKRKWVEQDVLEKEREAKLKKAKLCRGQKPHDFLLVLPSYVPKLKGDHTQEEIEEYYLSEKRVAEFMEQEKENLAKYGIGSRSSFRLGRQTKYYECSICRKKEYSDMNEKSPR